jgi:hypothetical protein
MCGVAATVHACSCQQTPLRMCYFKSKNYISLMLYYFAVGKTGAVLRSDNFADGKIVVA